MASGDTIISMPSMQITNNVLTFMRSDGSTTDSGSFVTDLGPNDPSIIVLNGNQCYVHATIRVDAIGADGPIVDALAIGHPLFDSAKTYDLIIKEH
jgi:hypothetical protein